MWDCGNVASKSCVVDPVDEDAEEGGGLFTCIWLELRLDLDDEGRCHGGEQTSLCAESVRLRPTNTGKKLTKIRVVFISSSYSLMNSRSYSSASWLYFS